MHVFEIKDGGERFWYVANTADAAKQEHLDSDICDKESLVWDSMEVSQLDDDRVLKIGNAADEGWPEQQTCAQWVTTAGPGYLASTCW
jgi:hypothetical protein